jgi:bacterial/archaeal transporter family protein
MKSALLSWQLWALLSAAFAALTAIFAKIGVENVSSDFATLIRTIIILLTLGFILAVTGEWQPLGSVSGRSYLFLTLSGLATGGSWVCYFRALKFGDAARVAPIDKLSVVLVALFASSSLASGYRDRIGSASCLLPPAQCSWLTRDEKDRCIRVQKPPKLATAWGAALLSRSAFMRCIEPSPI